MGVIMNSAPGPTKTCSKTQYISYTAKALCESRADGRATADAGGKLRSGRQGSLRSAMGSRTQKKQHRKDYWSTPRVVVVWFWLVWFAHLCALPTNPPWPSREGGGLFRADRACSDNGPTLAKGQERWSGAWKKLYSRRIMAGQSTLAGPG